MIKKNLKKVKNKMEEMKVMKKPNKKKLVVSKLKNNREDYLISIMKTKVHIYIYVYIFTYKMILWNNLN